MVHIWLWLLTLYTLSLTPVCTVASWEIPVSDRDRERLVCSGMWGGGNAYIEVSYDLKFSRGQLAMVIYESRDEPYLGKAYGPPGVVPKTYVCSSIAIRDGLCEKSQYGRFILDLPPGRTVEDTSFWSAGMRFRESANGHPNSSVNRSLKILDERSKSQTAPCIDYLRQRRASSIITTRPGVRPSPTDIVCYDGPIRYVVRELGYYCIAIVPVIAWQPKGTSASSIPGAPRYGGTILFRNTFNGRLPASEHPKLHIYFALFCGYLTLAIAWSCSCWQNAERLLTVQYRVSALLGAFVLNEFVSWMYYYRRNTYGEDGISAAFHVIVSSIDSTSDAFAFYVLLVMAHGHDVLMTPIERKTKVRAALLAFAQSALGVLNATVGTMEPMPQDPDYLFIIPRKIYLAIPLACTTLTFVIWIAHALTGGKMYQNEVLPLIILAVTITQLSESRQRYKLSLYLSLRRNSLLAVVFATFIQGVAFSVTPSRADSVDFEEIPDNDSDDLGDRAAERSASDQGDTSTCIAQTAHGQADNFDGR
ncbi:hypothetical protein NUW54_g2183 [Trametes sanguinea]|uniref:Uncharacterized protein n=1 Tax=Trametes sanguinea TaxID=158606 RepID=A0ACC1Q4W2_9APHY|nr:hypothetical protein NUW54_g2183 [Trametes sanguinea]